MILSYAKEVRHVDDCSIMSKRRVLIVDEVDQRSLERAEQSLVEESKDNFTENDKFNTMRRYLDLSKIKYLDASVNQYDITGPVIYWFLDD